MRRFATARACRVASWFLLAAAVAGCATPSLQKSALAPVQARDVFELDQTPFFPQTVHQCGPAALATVLVASGVSTSPEGLTGEIYIPEREGSLQAELIAATRRHARVAVRLPASTEALLDSVASGQPVLVLQNLRFKRWPAWHYAVLVGWNASRDELILRSGTEKRETLSLARFLQTWTLADRWAVTIADPAKPPPQAVEAADWIAAIAPLESLGQLATAAAAYGYATERWPDSALAWLALANARYAQHDLASAEQALESAVALQADAATLNNLAQVRLERGCAKTALDALNRIGSVPPALQQAVDDTRRQIESASSSRASICDAAS